MLDSIYIGLSGLTAYSKGLQIVSNNVTNMNTVGFKSSDVTFGNIYGAGSSGGLDLSQAYGGSGHGVVMNDLSINFSQGELRQTNRDLDLAVDGNGFLVLIDGDNNFFTRTGSFTVDDDGFVVLDGTEYRLAMLDDASRPVAINIDALRTDPPEATTRVTFADNLSSTATTYLVSDLKVYNDNGKELVWSVSFTRAEGVANDWTVKVTDASGRTIGEQHLKFLGGIVDPTTDELTFTDTENNLSVVFDFSKNVSSFSTGTVSSLKAKDVEGHPTGTIATLKANSDGQLEISYTNGEKHIVGSLALADFQDPHALEQKSRSLFAYNGYGRQEFLAATDDRVGTILGGRLEASNVDLGAQFGELILIQRGFQASSQVISTTNDMIQQLFGIRGQG